MQPSDRSSASVLEIWCYPVRALGGVAVPGIDVGTDGLIGDRRWTVVADGVPRRVKENPQLAGLVATGVPATDLLMVSEALGRPVVLEERGLQPGGAPVHLVSRQARERAARGDVPAGCSAEDPRANLLLDLVDPDDDERSWVGRQVEVGGVVLAITQTPKYCLGVYAEVRRPGRLAVGDPVTLQP